MAENIRWRKILEGNVNIRLCFFTAIKFGYLLNDFQILNHALINFDTGNYK